LQAFGISFASLFASVRPVMDGVFADLVDGPRETETDSEIWFASLFAS
jgi:hypothetical protein